jgi:cytochrome c-type biogenesis protein CcmH
MPIAAVKLMASDLPREIILDDNASVMPQMKLSDFEQVNVYAVISQQGSVGIKPGDYKGEQLNVKLADISELTMVIDTQVSN